MNKVKNNLDPKFPSLEEYLVQGEPGQRANYSNLPKGVPDDYTGLEHFFSNLLFGAKYELKKRYLHVDAAKQGFTDGTWRAAYPLSTPQVTPQVQGIVMVLGGDGLSASKLREKMGLKDAKNFRENYLRPAISEGYITMSNPDKPNSNRQKYSLTAKGQALLSQINAKGGDR